MRMKKLFKKVLGLSLTVIMLLSLAVPVSADSVGVDLLSVPLKFKSTTTMKSGTDISFAFEKNEGADAEDTQAWADAVTSVKIGETALSTGQYALTSSTITFIRTDSDEVFTETNAKNISGRVSTYDLTISAAGYSDLTGMLTLNDYGAKTFQIRVVDGEGNIYPIKTYSWDQLESMKQSGDAYYNTICWMAGLRTFKAEGVLLTDLLEDAGVNFGPGMVLQVRTNDKAVNENDSTTEDAYYNNAKFTYDYIMGKSRYYLPSIYTDANMKSGLLNGKNSDENVRALLASDPNKSEVTPMIGLRYVETVYKSDSESPADTPYSSLLSDEKAFRFLFGLALTDDGTMVEDDVTTWAATYCAFGVDIIDPDYTPPYEYKDETSGISLAAGAKVLDQGTIAKVQIITQGEKYQKVAFALGDIADKFMLYDISLLLDNQEVQPNGKVKVSLPIPDEYDRDRLAIYWIDEDGNAVKVEGSIEGNYYVFETDHFSFYSLVEAKAEVIAVDDNNTDGTIDSTPDTNTKITGTIKTGDSTPISPFLVTMIGAAVLIVSLIVAKIKMRKKQGLM